MDTSKVKTSSVNYDFFKNRTFISAGSNIIGEKQTSNLAIASLSKASLKTDQKNLLSDYFSKMSISSPHSQPMRKSVSPPPAASLEDNNRITTCSGRSLCEERHLIKMNDLKNNDPINEVAKNPNTALCLLKNVNRPFA